MRDECTGSRTKFRVSEVAHERFCPSRRLPGLSAFHHAQVSRSRHIAVVFPSGRTRASTTTQTLCAWCVPVSDPHSIRPRGRDILAGHAGRLAEEHELSVGSRAAHALSRAGDVVHDPPCPLAGQKVPLGCLASALERCLLDSLCARCGTDTSSRLCLCVANHCSRQMNAAPSCLRTTGEGHTHPPTMGPMKAAAQGG